MASRKRDTILDVVRVEGVEPPRLAALDPKSSVSTNFTTPATFASSFVTRLSLDVFQSRLSTGVQR